MNHNEGQMQHYRQNSVLGTVFVSLVANSRNMTSLS